MVVFVKQVFLRIILFQFISVFCLLAILPVFINCKSATTAKQINQSYEDYLKNLKPLAPLAKNIEYTLNLRILHDPSLPALTISEYQEIFKKLEALTLTSLGYKIKIQWSEDFKDLDSYLMQNRARYEHPLFSFPIKEWYIDFYDPQVYPKIEKVVKEVFETTDPLILKKYFGFMNDDRQQNITKVTQLFINKTASLLKTPDLLQKPLYSAEYKKRREQISYAHWSAFLQQEEEVDFYITNSIIAGPDSGMPIYVINRASITNAFVENNAKRPLQGVGLLATLPFLSDADFFLQNRGRLNLAQKKETILYLLLHELGHLLARKKENYTLEKSIHRAPPDLRYYDWVLKVRENPSVDSEKVPTLRLF